MDIMLSYALVRPLGWSHVENPVEITGGMPSNRSKINLLSKLHRIRSVRALLKSHLEICKKRLIFRMKVIGCSLLASIDAPFARLRL